MIASFFFLVFALPAFAQEVPPIIGTNQVDVYIGNDFYLTSQAIADGVSYGGLVGDYTNSSSLVSDNSETFVEDFGSFLGNPDYASDLSSADFDFTSEYLQVAPITMADNLNYDAIREYADTTDFGRWFAPTNFAELDKGYSLGGFSNRWTSRGYDIPTLASNTFERPPVVTWDQLYFDFSKIHPGLRRVQMSEYDSHISAIVSYTFSILRLLSGFFGFASLWHLVRELF